MSRNEAGLTPKQAAFVREYLLDHNATQAAIRAGYSKANANKIGSELLGKTRLAAEIARGEKATADKLEVSKERVLRELARLAFGDLTQITAQDGRILPVKDWPQDMRGAVGQIEVLKRNVMAGDGHTDDVLKVRLWDKTRALEMLRKHLGLFEESQRLTGEFTVRWAE